MSLRNYFQLTRLSKSHWTRYQHPHWLNFDVCDEFRVMRAFACWCESFRPKWRNRDARKCKILTTLENYGEFTKRTCVGPSRFTFLFLDSDEWCSSSAFDLHASLQRDLQAFLASSKSSLCQIDPNSFIQQFIKYSTPIRGESISLPPTHKFWCLLKYTRCLVGSLLCLSSDFVETEIKSSA